MPTEDYYKEEESSSTSEPIDQTQTEEYKLIKELRDALLRTQWMKHHNLDNLNVIRKADNYLHNCLQK